MPSIDAARFLALTALLASAGAAAAACGRGDGAPAPKTATAPVSVAVVDVPDASIREPDDEEVGVETVDMAPSDEGYTAHGEDDEEYDDDEYAPSDEGGRARAARIAGMLQALDGGSMIGVLGSGSGVSGLGYGATVGGGGIGVGSIGTGSYARGPNASSKVRAGSSNVKGALAPEIVQRIVRRHLNQIKYCYEKELRKDPKFAPKIAPRFVIGPKGTVLTASVGKSSGRASFDGCVAAALKRMQFPQPKGGGVVTVSYPFTFQAAP